MALKHVGLTEFFGICLLVFPECSLKYKLFSFEQAEHQKYAIIIIYWKIVSENRFCRGQGRFITTENGSFCVLRRPLFLYNCYHVPLYLLYLPLLLPLYLYVLPYLWATSCQCSEYANCIFYVALSNFINNKYAQLNTVIHRTAWNYYRL